MTVSFRCVSDMRESALARLRTSTSRGSDARSGRSRPVDTAAFDQTVIRQSAGHAYRVTYVPRQHVGREQMHRRYLARIPRSASAYFKNSGNALLKIISNHAIIIKSPIMPVKMEPDRAHRDRFIGIARDLFYVMWKKAGKEERGRKKKTEKLYPTVHRFALKFLHWWQKRGKREREGEREREREREKR